VLLNPAAAATTGAGAQPALNTQARTAPVVVSPAPLAAAAAAERAEQADQDMETPLVAQRKGRGAGRKQVLLETPATAAASIAARPASATAAVAAQSAFKRPTPYTTEQMAAKRSRREQRAVAKCAAIAGMSAHAAGPSAAADTVGPPAEAAAGLPAAVPPAACRPQATSAARPSPGVSVDETPVAAVRWGAKREAGSVHRCWTAVAVKKMRARWETCPTAGMLYSQDASGTQCAVQLGMMSSLLCACLACMR
jgi:hypothetical protein